MHISGSDGFRILHADAEPMISTSDDVNDVIGSAWGESISLIALPVARLDPEFFRLRSGLAGDILQKFVNYRLPVAVIGDIAEFTAASDALRDFVWESNRGDHVWFLPDEAALTAKIASRNL
jgi:hypothetical protein